MKDSMKKGVYRQHVFFHTQVTREFLRAISVQTLCQISILFMSDISGNEELDCSLKMQLCVRV